MELNDLLEQMGSSITEFQYQKLDGTIRTAKGTLNADIIVSLGGALPKGDKEVTQNPGYHAYFDTEKMGWRCFLDNRLQ